MALTAVVTRDAELERRARASLELPFHDLMVSPHWSAARRHLRERPVGILIVDVRSLTSGSVAARLEGVRRRFPSVPLGVVGSCHEPQVLYELGRVGLRHVILAEEGGARVLHRMFRDLLGETVSGRVVRALSPALARRPLGIVRNALEVTHRRLSAEAFSQTFHMSRPHMSRILREAGLPSTGHLLGWARLLHAGHWLPDPERSGDSVARQLEFANGSTFRRALRNYVDLTPSEVVDGGGLDPVLRALRRHTGLHGVVCPLTRRVA